MLQARVRTVRGAAARLARFEGRGTCLPDPNASEDCLRCPSAAPARRRVAHRTTIALWALTAALAGSPAAAHAVSAPEPMATRAAGTPGGLHWAALPAPPAPARAAALTRPTWLSGVLVTEYYPVPESWFQGRRVRPPGLTTSHRIDWLYSARGVTMQGTGIGLNGRFYHVDALGRGGWVDRMGRPAPIGGLLEVFWRAGGFWRNARGALTFPLEAGGWFNGVGVRYVPLVGVTFAPGHGRPGMTYYRSLAVDPALIPMGSRVHIPAYRDKPGGGWFVAQDTGGAIRGRHVDVYRSPPRGSADAARSLTAQRILVVPPGQRPPPTGQAAPVATPAPSGPATGGSPSG